MNRIDCDCGVTHYRQAFPVEQTGLTWPEIVGLVAQVIAAIIVGSVAFAFLFGMAVGS